MPHMKGGILKWAAVSVRLSVACLDLTRELKVLRSPKLAVCKRVTRVTHEPN